jgi:hypothetical protein
MSKGYGIGSVLALACAFCVLASPATAATTTCAFGGPAGTFRAIELDVDQPGTALNVTLDAAYSNTGLTNASWHLAAGIIVVDLGSMQPVAYSLASDGLSPRRALIAIPGQAPVATDTPGPGVPLRREAVAPAPGLAPGHYAVVAFASDGDGAEATSGPPFWRAALLVDGQHSCVSRGQGSMFDHDISDFSGGTTVAAGPAVYADGAELATSVNRELVVGLIDAGGGPGGSAEVAFEHPSSSGTVSGQIKAFASRGGAFKWTANATAALASIDIAGVALDLPGWEE